MIETCDVALRFADTDEARVCRFAVAMRNADAVLSAWVEGPWACDCNRARVFFGAEAGDDFPCNRDHVTGGEFHPNRFELFEITPVD